MTSPLSSLRTALRGLQRTPAFALTAIGTLALGIGIAVAVFAVADALLLRRLPVREQERVVVLKGASRDGRFDNFPLSIREVRDFATHARSLERAELFSYDDPFPRPVRDGDRTWRMRQSHVSGEFFATTLAGTDSSVAAVNIIARLRPGKTLGSARSELTAYFPAVRRAVADVAPGVSLVSATPFDDLLMRPRAQPPRRCIRFA